MCSTFFDLSKNFECDQNEWKRKEFVENTPPKILNLAKNIQTHQTIFENIKNKSCQKNLGLIRWARHKLHIDNFQSQNLKNRSINSK